LTEGAASDYTQAENLIKDTNAEYVLADKGYDADYVIAATEATGAKAVIPPRKGRKIMREYDKNIYKERNIIERLFNKLKHYRRISTRYDKYSSSYLAFLHLVSTILWIS